MSKEISRRTLLGGGMAGLIAAAGPGSKRKPAPKRGESAPAPSQPLNPYAPFETRVNELLAQSRVPGASIAIVRGGQIAYTNAFGLANVETGKAMTAETVFQAASLTKPFFAYAVLKACERGQLGLDKPLTTYIPHTRISRDPRAHRITARHVLSHMSGLPNWENGKRPMKLVFDPGEHFGYSSEAFNCLQEVIEKQTGQPLNDLLTETIALPAGLSESSFVWKDAYDTTAAIAYEWDGTPVKSRSKPTEATAASSLHTTARDYAKFMLASVGREEANPEQLEYVGERMMLSPQVRLTGTLAWGLGWALQLEDNGDLNWHFGDSRGYMSYAALSRSTGNGIVVFTNSRHGLRLCHAIAKEVLDNQDPIFTWIYDVFYEGKLQPWPTA